MRSQGHLRNSAPFFKLLDPGGHSPWQGCIPRRDPATLGAAGPLQHERVFPMLRWYHLIPTHKCTCYILMSQTLTNSGRSFLPDSHRQPEHGPQRLWDLALRREKESRSQVNQDSAGSPLHSTARGWMEPTKLAPEPYVLHARGAQPVLCWVSGLTRLNRSSNLSTNVTQPDIEQVLVWLDGRRTVDHLCHESSRTEIFPRASCKKPLIV